MGLKVVTGLQEIDEEMKRTEQGGKNFNFLLLQEGESKRFYFLHNPDEAVGYYEHVFTDNDGWHYVPCQDDCPLCGSGDEQMLRKPFRVAYLIMPCDERKGYILKANRDLQSIMENSYERQKTMMNMPYLVSRIGSGIDTKYNLEKDPIKGDKDLPENVLEKLGIEVSATAYIKDVLQQQIDSYFGADGIPKTSQPIDDIWDADEAGQGKEPDKTASTVDDIW